MDDAVETPLERHARYLRQAERACDIAEQSALESIRERYLKLALEWTIMADEILASCGA